MCVMKQELTCFSCELYVAQFCVVSMYFLMRFDFLLSVGYSPKVEKNNKSTFVFVSIVINKNTIYTQRKRLTGRLVWEVII